MLSFSDYQITEQIYESANSVVFRARRETDHQHVILKTLQGTYPSPERIARFQREYEMTRNLNPSTGPEHALQGVIAAHNLVYIQHRWTMVLEDFGGDSLTAMEVAGQFDLVDFLTLAIEVTDILGQIHLRHIIHKDVNPSNIVWNPKTGQVKLIDFGISTLLSRESPVFRHPNTLEGTLVYISPEQTGRMNRAIDYRTDFYSLGVTFYELLTGQLPFQAEDALELVHCHLAKMPVPPYDVVETDRSTSLRVLSDIILKLLAKNAEDRYQSASGVKHDLEHCLEIVKSLTHSKAGSGGDFALAHQDFSGRLTIPQKLYGREQEIDMLLAAFDHIATPQSHISHQIPVLSQAEGSQMLFVAGYSGVGKSALVHEIHRPVTVKHGFFLEGKFDQLQRSVPYSAWSQAFTTLINQLLMESPEHMAAWQTAIRQAVGDGGKVLADVIPNLTLLIGEQLPVAELGAVETQRRLHYVLHNVLRVIAQPAHPLVIFLDDLQWADAASLTLLQALVTGSTNHHLLIIGAYRDNEVSPAHPLSLMMRDVQEQHASIETLHLDNLLIEHVTQLLTETLDTSHSLEPDELRELADMVYEKTWGNAFFVTQFLRSLAEADLLTFDFNRLRWNWNIEQIRTLGITSNVVEWLAGQARHLPEDTLTVLQLAACIGNRFGLMTLAIIAEKTIQETARALQTGLLNGLILPLDQQYQLADLDIPNLETVVGRAAYAFAHDRIQQAMYSLIPDQDRKTIHLRIGRLLLKDLVKEQHHLEEHLFDVVNHWNVGLDLLEIRSEREQLARLNLQAGQKARSAAAFQLAFDYAQTGLCLLNEQSWSHNYDLTLHLHTFATQVAYLSNNYEHLEMLADTTLEHAREALDKVKIYEVIIPAQHARPSQAVQTGLEILALLGVSVPHQPDQEQVQRAVTDAQTSLTNFFGAHNAGSDHQGINRLLDLPDMTDPYQLAIIRIIASMNAPAKRAAPGVLLIMVAKAIQLLVEHGNTAYSAEIYCLYGIILCSVTEDIEAGYQFGQLALTALERLESQEKEADIMLDVNCMISHWKASLRETFKGLMKAYQRGLESGDWLVAAGAIDTHNSRSIYAGRELTDIEQDFVTFYGFIAQTGRKNYLHFLYWQVVENLIAASDHPCILVGSHLDEGEMLQFCIENNRNNALWHFYLNKLMLSFLFRDYRQAAEYAAIGGQYADRAIGGIDVPIYCFYDALTQLALWPGATQDEHERLLDKVRANQEKMFAWAKHAPANFLHKYHLVEAERCAVLGQNGEARELYDKAIALAEQYEYLNEEALARELAGEFYLRNGHDELARLYLRNAHYAYRRWGALAKVTDLEARYPHWLGNSDGTKTETATTRSTTTLDSGERFDLETVMKAAQAISSEIALERLLAKSLYIVMESAGADKGVLILKQAETLAIEAVGLTDEGDVTVAQAIPVTEADDVPQTLINYVARTRESIVLNDAANEGQFTQDDYISTRQLKSVACTPLLNQGNVIGILYLENNLTTAVFTPARMKMLKVLSTQAAISLENARLYEHLEDKVKERTAEVIRQKEEIERQHHKLLTLDEFKEGMMSMIVHDLKNPLNSILNVSPSFSIEKRLQMVQQSGKQMLTMVMNILDVQKFEDTNMILETQNHPLYEVTDRAVQQVRFLSRRKNITIRNVIPHHVAVEIDADIIERVFVNLLTNGIKYTPNNGEITTRTSQVSPLNKISTPDVIRVEVTDTGEGISEDALDTVFDKFTQVVPKSSGRVRSTGLGLTFCKLAVEAHGGNIGLESDIGKGTTVWFTLCQAPEMIQPDVKAVDERTMSDTGKPFTLSEAEKVVLRPFIEELNTLKIYKATQIRKILKQIDPTGNEQITLWKEALQEALRNRNEEQYKEMLTL